MGFWETVGKGIHAAAEAAQREKQRQDEIYGRYSNYDDKKLADIYRSKDDGWFAPGSREKRIAAKILKERGY